MVGGAWHAAAGAQVGEAEWTVCLLNARNACWRAFVFSEKDLVTVCDALHRGNKGHVNM